MNRFELIRSFPGGHRFYVDRESSRIAVADQSVFDNPLGRDLGPEATADGVLWLDFSRAIRRTRGKAFAPTYLVPIQVPESETDYVTVCSPAEADWLVETFAFVRHQ